MAATTTTSGAFPRGGQRVLTALDRRNMTRKAEEDAEIELTTGKSVDLFQEDSDNSDDEGGVSVSASLDMASMDVGNESEGSGDDGEDGAKKGKTNKRASSTALLAHGKTKLKKGEGKKKQEPHVVYLTQSRLVPGMKVLGAVRNIRKTTVQISLVGGHTATVLLEDSSAPLVEAASNPDEAKPDTAKRLKDIFTINQLVACAVMDEPLPDAEKSGGVVRVTLDPSAVNSGCDSSFLTKNRVLWACVSSIEDRGCLLDVGIPDVSVFVPAKEVAFYSQAHDDQPLLAGQMLFCVITSEKTGRTAKASIDPAKVVAGKSISSHHPTLATFAPGELVECTVKATMPGGLKVTFCDGFEAEVDSMHLPGPGAEFTKKKAMGRIVYLNPSENQIGISLRYPVVNMALPVSAMTGGAKADATIVSVMQGRGVLAKLSDGFGFCSIKGLSDDGAAIDLKKFKEGSEKSCRIISYNAMDGIYRLTFKQSTVDTEYYSVEDLEVGQTVKATVVSLSPEGVKLDLSKQVQGICPPLHMADVTLKHPEKKFVKGDVVNCRVLSIKHKGIVLTNKRLLVQSDLPILSSYENAVEGTEYHGVVTAIQPYGCFVSFYNNISGLVPKSEMSSTVVLNTEDVVRIGQVVRCRVMSVDAENKRLSLSMRSDSTASTSLIKSIASGTLINLKVTKVQNTGLSVETIEPSVPAFIATEQLCDQPGLADKMIKLYQEGSIIENAVVVTCDTRHKHKPSLVLSLKPILKEAAMKGDAPKTMAELSEGQVLSGYVASVTDQGVFVTTLHGLHGLAPRRHLARGPLRDPTQRYAKGQTVLVAVEKVTDGKLFFKMVFDALEGETERPIETLYAHSLFSTLDTLTAATSDNLASLPKVGHIDEFTVDSIKPYGFLGKLANGQAAMLSKEQAQDLTVEVGTTLPCVVLDVDSAAKTVDVGVRSALVAAVKAANTPAPTTTTTTTTTPSKKKTPKKSALPTAVVKPEFNVGAISRATVELVKNEYAVISTASGIVCICSNKSFSNSSSPFGRFVVGREGTAACLFTHNGTHVAAFVQDKQQKLGDDESKDSHDKDSTKSKETSDDVTSTTSTTTLPKVGEIVQAHINSIKDFQMNIQIGKARGRVHISEVTDKISTDSPFAPYKEGMEITVKVIGTHEGKTHKTLAITRQHSATYTLLDCSLRKSVISGKSEPLTADKVTIGMKVVGYVHDIEANHMRVNISTTVSARISRFVAGRTMKEACDLVDSFRLGQAVVGYIVAKHSSVLEMSLLGPSITFKKGDLVLGEIELVDKLHVAIKLGHTMLARAHITDCADSYPKTPSTSYETGAIVQCRVISVDGEKVNLSMRPSVCGGATNKVEDPVISSIDDVNTGDVYRGYVTNVSDVGVYVALGRSVSARIKIANLSDLFLQNFKKVFTVGMLVRGRVLSKENDHIEMSLKMSDVDPAHYRAPVKLKDLKPDSIVSGKVKRVEAYGLFIAITGSTLTGMCHITEVSAERIKDLKELYKEGDIVRAVIISIAPDTKRISLSLKNPLLRGEGNMLTQNDDEEDEKIVVQPKHGGDFLAGTAPATAEETESNENGHDSSKQQLDTVHLEYNSDDDAESELPRKRKHASTNGKTESGAALDVGAFSWQQDTYDALLRGHVADDIAAIEDEGDTDADESARKLSKRAKKAALALEEERIQAKEKEALASGDPQTPEAFDRALLAQPDSSLLWIKYMALYLQMTEIDKARQVAEKALRVINVRQEAERMNVWVARLNLEASYGTPESTQKVFAESTSANDALQMHQHMAAIFTRRGQTSEAEAVHLSMVKKYKANPRVWLQYAKWALDNGDEEKGREVLQRAMQSLPKTEHVGVIVQFSLLQFKAGSLERARATFESVLANYPKRTDVWNVLLDQELRVGDATVVRALFERIITLSLSTKKMKNFFKRYLDFEKAQNNESGVEHVKAKARAYVQDYMA